MSSTQSVPTSRSPEALSGSAFLVVEGRSSSEGSADLPRGAGEGDAEGEELFLLRPRLFSLVRLESRLSLLSERSEEMLRRRAARRLRDLDRDELRSRLLLRDLE